MSKNSNNKNNKPNQTEEINKVSPANVADVTAETKDATVDVKETVAETPIPEAKEDVSEEKNKTELTSNDVVDSKVPSNAKVKKSLNPAEEAFKRALKTCGFDVKEGVDVVVKPEAKRTVTGTEFPPYAYKIVYRIDKILSDRIIIKCESLKFAVSPYDIKPFDKKRR